MATAALPTLLEGPGPINPGLFSVSLSPSFNPFVLSFPTNANGAPGWGGLTKAACLGRCHPRDPQTRSDCLSQPTTAGGRFPYYCLTYPPRCSGVPRVMPILRGPLHPSAFVDNPMAGVGVNL